ncbi:MAG: LuxR C-terminal-related transcriptional regulator [Fimbriimonadales bacterium]|nr:LuxR C-terminal-related transcriptional regulator [Fimbriimonadales bacterium]
MDYKLTERERNILHLFAQGQESEAIAEQLGITTEQVEQVSLNVLYKLFGSSLNHTLDTSSPAEERELVGVS